ncbi:MAG: hypothetical protein NXI20_18230 [bacterium]|nr:hypothetical protein [bacterium]
MKTAPNKKIMRLSLLVFAWVLAISAFAQEYGSATGHGYINLEGNTSNYPDSKLRIVKWSNNNAHLDVMDGKNLMFNYYTGGHVYFGKATSAAHSIFRKDGILGINTLTPASGYNLDVNGKIKSRYLYLSALSGVEGGEMQLAGSTGYNGYVIDNYAGRLRMHHQVGQNLI